MGFRVVKAAILAAVGALAWSSAAFANDGPAAWRTSSDDGGILDWAAVGVAAHDVIVSDGYEEGVDISLELALDRIEAWDWFGSPQPTIGANINTDGWTSWAHASLYWDFNWTDRFFQGIYFGFAVHDGEVEREPDFPPCVENDNCGFGSRGIFRIAFDVAGYRINDKYSAAIFIDHISHLYILDDDNEGVENVGLRIMRKF